ncbi:MAG TPA: DMT family transporter [Candidatus Limnocylindrales bacterium]|nr:DMT family transporter [Candidatus Limnocylindrales bacterium]
MDPYALAAIAIAAVLHATWNILLKTAGDPLRTATVGVVAASAILVPLAAVAWLATGRPELPPAAWAVGIVSGVVETAYFVFLAAAYRRGDLSVVYPIARGSAPVLAVLVGVTVLGERLPPVAWLGVGLLVAGLLVVQRPWTFFLAAGGGSSRDAPAGAGFALLTGAMIATYSSLDRVGVQLAPPWLYAAVLWPVCGLGLLVVAYARPRIRGGLYAPPDVPLDVPGAVAGGLLTFTAYGFVLAALARAPLAIVAPLRESAVVLASTWGVVRLGEAADRQEVALRIAGSALVLAGATVLAVGR